VPESLARHAIAAPGWEKVVGLTLEQYLHSRAVDKVSEPTLGFIAKRNEPLAIAFADDSKNALIEIDLLLLEIDQFRYPQACRVQQLEHGAVTMTQWLVGVRCM
jgi:hypothetical protein